MQFSNHDRQEYPHLLRPERGYIFVATYGRTGSTVLMKTLNTIPGSCIRGENNNSLAPLMRSIDLIKTETNFSIRREQAALPFEERGVWWQKMIGKTDDPWYGAELVRPRAYALSLLDSYVRHILNPPETVSYLGFKDIHYYKNGPFFDDTLRLMLHFFPNARIVFLTRDLDQVSQSAWWKDIPKETVITQLQDANRKFEQFFSANQDRCYMIDHTDLLRGLDGVMPLFDFLEADVDAEAVEGVLNTRLTHLSD